VREIGGGREEREEGAGREIGDQRQEKRERGTDHGDQGNQIGREQTRGTRGISFWRLLPMAQPSQKRRLAIRLERLGVEAPPSALGRLAAFKTMISEE
jgi:hypothetical protein